MSTDPTTHTPTDLAALHAENQRLRAKLEEAEETLRAIREGEVDAIVVAGSQGDQIFSLTGAESIYRRIVETMQEAAFTVAPDGAILSGNPQVASLLQSPAGSILGRPLAAFVVPEERAALADILARSLAAPVQKRLVFQTPDGTSVPTHVSAQVVQQPEGISICIVATDLRALEASLETLRQIRERAEELAAIFEAVPAITFLAHDPECRRMSCSRVTRHLLRLSDGINVSLSAPDGERPTAFRILHAGRELAPDELPIQRAAATGREVRDVDLTLAFDDGTCRDIFGHAVPLFDAAGRVRGAVGAFADVTERNWAETALRESHAKLEQRVAARTVELSTALAQLSAQAAQVRSLASELTLVEQRERVRLAGVLHDGLQQLLVAAKLRVTMLERRGDPTVRQSSQEIGRLLEEAIADARSLTAELSPPILRAGGLLAGLPWLARWVRETHHLTVQVVAPAALPPVSEDVTILFFQAVREILFNAVKYAQVAEATVILACDAQGLTLTVADAGVGFDPTGLRGEGGAGGGFGLATIRHRLELLGGCMQIVSAPGQGTRVTLAMRLPTAASPARLPERPPAPALEPPRPIRVLLVDDHLAVRQAFAQILGAEADLAVVGEAGTGTAAVALARELAPDVVLMDANLPELTGIEATRALHAACPTVRVIGLSMYDHGDHAAAMRAAGAAAYVSKDAPPEVLLAAIRGDGEHHLGTAPGSAGPERSSDAAAV